MIHLIAVITTKPVAHSEAFRSLQPAKVDPVLAVADTDAVWL